MAIFIFLKFIMNLDLYHHTITFKEFALQLRYLYTDSANILLTEKLRIVIHWVLKIYHFIENY